MARLRFTRRAEQDLLQIARHTLRTWGQGQALRYIDDLEDCCRSLAEDPLFGRACDEIRRGLRRIECGRHVIFYRPARGGIRVIRVLHQRMLPVKHLT